MNAQTQSARTEAPRTRCLAVREVACLQVRVASSWRSRMLGLAGIDRDAAPPALLISGCRSVHTFGMRFPLDLVFFDAEMRVVGRRWRLQPRRFALERRARSVLEIPSVEVPR